MTKSIFFYKTVEFRNLNAGYAKLIYMKNTSEPEQCGFFWDNVRGESTKEKYGSAQCEILKAILLQNMEIELRDTNEFPDEPQGLFIRNRADDGKVARLDYRDASNGELRGKLLQQLLVNYAKKHNESKESVYDALRNLMHSSYPIDFQGIKIMFHLDQFVMDAYISIVDEKLKEKKCHTEDEALEKYENEFIPALEAKCRESLNSYLETDEFFKQALAENRKKVILSELDNEQLNEAWIDYLVFEQPEAEEDFETYRARFNPNKNSSNLSQADTEELNPTFEESKIEQFLELALENPAMTAGAIGLFVCAAILITIGTMGVGGVAMAGFTAAMVGMGASVGLPAGASLVTGSLLTAAVGGAATGGLSFFCINGGSFTQKDEFDECLHPSDGNTPAF